MLASSASVTAGRPPGPRRAKPLMGMTRSPSSGMSAGQERATAPDTGGLQKSGRAQARQPVGVHAAMTGAARLPPAGDGTDPEGWRSAPWGRRCRALAGRVACARPEFRHRGRAVPGQEDVADALASGSGVPSGAAGGYPVSPLLRLSVRPRCRARCRWMSGPAARLADGRSGPPTGPRRRCLATPARACRGRSRRRRWRRSR